MSKLLKGGSVEGSILGVIKGILGVYAVAQMKVAICMCSS